MFSGENDMAKNVWTDTAKQGYIVDEGEAASKNLEA